MASGENLGMRHFVVRARPWGVAMTAVTVRLAAGSGWFGLPWLIAALDVVTVVGVGPR
ncbi:Uncharacterised protein [Mycobacteroides abscessus subsp. abscessus]|nr:Uncharacterised protein [Mycobacteroides abscessus subsp. abscessus]SIC79711.1 Uncharacterised protein [Mycobacteroides abscessus subsp. abscessus]SKK32815.1 Uncharacterised protein [Mycobacteroides abscessus subsp. abscessus]SKP26482.1 Uncharacterised protein [Mycobacteroides abscessus subsp. abscessus]